MSLIIVGHQTTDWWRLVSWLRVESEKQRRIDREDASGGFVGAVGPDGTDLAFATDMVLVVVGVRPDTELASNAGVELGPKGAIAEAGFGYDPLRPRRSHRRTR